MIVEVRCGGAREVEATAAMREQITRALHGHLSRIKRVVVRLEGEGEAGALCHIDVQGDRVWRVIVEEVAPDAGAAVELAAQRLPICVAQALERQQRTRSRGPLPWPATRLS